MDRGQHTGGDRLAAAALEGDGRYRSSWLARPRPMTQAKLELIDSSASGIDGAVRLLIAGKHGERCPT